MAKQADRQKASPFDALRIARLADDVPSGVAAESVPVQAVKQLDSQLAKSVDPAYVKFTTYVRKKTHLAVKSRLVAQERELSDLVEELLQQWLASQ